jgi:hypothetical protein
MKKTYYCVMSEYYRDGRILACIKTSSRKEKPKDVSGENPWVKAYNTWYDSQEEAEAELARIRPLKRYYLVRIERRLDTGIARARLIFWMYAPQPPEVFVYSDRSVDVLNVWYESEDEALAAVRRSGGELWQIFRDGEDVADGDMKRKPA